MRCWVSEACPRCTTKCDNLLNWNFSPPLSILIIYNFSYSYTCHNEPVFQQCSWHLSLSSERRHCGANKHRNRSDFDDSHWADVDLSLLCFQPLIIFVFIFLSVPLLILMLLMFSSGFMVFLFFGPRLIWSWFGHQKHEVDPRADSEQRLDCVNWVLYLQSDPVKGNVKAWTKALSRTMNT